MCLADSDLPLLKTSQGFLLATSYVRSATKIIISPYFRSIYNYSENGPTRWMSKRSFGLTGPDFKKMIARNNISSECQCVTETCLV